MMNMLLASAVAALLTASPLAAAQADGSPSKPREVRALHSLAACVAGKREADVRRVLAIDFREREYGRELRRLAGREASCGKLIGNSTIRADGVLFAGTLAELLVERDLGGGDLAPRVAYDASRPVLEARNGAELMAVCVVRRAPAETISLLRTEAASAAEIEQLRAMSAALSGCIPPGQQVRLNRESIRALLSLAAYRLSTHNAAPHPPAGSN